ncbi:sciellin isoform 2-T2 [Aulostomus maculatus]
MSKYTSRTTRTSQSSLLKDNSWIRKPDDEDEDVDRDPNFGKVLLRNYKTDETPGRSESEEVTTTRTSTTSSSVQALTKRFSTGQDELNPTPSSKTSRSSFTKSTYSTVQSPTSITTSKTTVLEEPKTSTKTTSVTKDGKTTETTITTTTETLRSPVTKSSKTETFSERVQSHSRGSQYSPYSPSSKSREIETTVASKKDAEDKLFDNLIPPSVSTTEIVTVKTSSVDAEDKLYDSLIPSSIKDDISDLSSQTTVSSTETVTVRSSSDGDGITTTTTTRTSTTPEDDLYDTLIPKSITSGLSSPVRSSSITKREIVTVESSRGGDSPTLASPSSTLRTTSYSSYTDDSPSTRTSSYTISSSKTSDDYSSSKSYSYSRPNSSYEYTSVTSPSEYTSTSYRRSEDILSDPSFSKSSVKSVYSERTVLEKDLCTSCHKPFTGDAKMVLDEMKINCHASCFKCEVCNSTLGHLKAGDSMWIYKHMVHCESCFDTTREKWRR